MLSFASDRIQHRPRGRFAYLLLSFFLFSVVTITLSAQTVGTYSFEDGTDGWSSFNGANVPVSSPAASYAGSHSLLITTSATGSGGPAISLNTVLQAGAKYTITGYIQLTGGEPAGNANFTISRSDASCSGGTCYDTVGAYETPVAGTGWAQIGGTYSVSATETGLNLYAQLVGATSAQSFYLDDVVITQTAPPPGGTSVANYDFTDGGLDGWAPFGSATLTNSASPFADPTGGTKSLLVGNRSATYMGPSLNLLNVSGITPGAVYQVTAYVLLAGPDSTGPTATLSSKTVDCAAKSGAYGTIATSGALSSAVWTKLQGTFSFSDLPGAPSSLTLFIQSSSATDSFFLGDVSISELSPAPLSASQQDNSGILSNFEDGGLDGWVSRTGTSAVSNSTADAHTGSHSLLTTGRVANYDGPQISVSNKMYVGSEYNLSAWVKLVPNDGSSHVLNFSLQTTLDGTTSYSSVTGYPGVTVAADGNWHQISVAGYTMGAAYDQGAAFLYLQTVPTAGNDLVSFYLDDFQLSYVAPPTIQTNIPSIYKTYSDYFPIGAEIDTTDLSGVHEQLLTKHFDGITSGNDMKWSSVETSKGVFNFTNADSEVGLAQCHNMRVRGHNLVWATGAQTPAYALGDGTNSPANQALVTANIQEHVQGEVQHFGKAVYAWDVVNEPLDPSQPDCLTRGPFYKVLGSKYLDVAFDAAKRYAPAGTKFFINDYSTTDTARLACLIKVVGELRERGVPITSVGHEMHNSINYPSPELVRHAINTVARELPGIDQQVTELDVSVYNAGDIAANYGNEIPASVLAEQGWLYERYFKVFRELKDKLSEVTIWGMADDDTWLSTFPVTRTEYPLPFDRQLQAKPAYWGIVDHTKLPGYGLRFSIAETRGGRGEKNTRVFTMTATNGDVGPAYATQITNFTLKQIFGRRCSPVVTPQSSFPSSLGDIPTGGAASTTFEVNFTGCGEDAFFTLDAPWTSSTYHTGNFFLPVLYVSRGRW